MPSEPSRIDDFDEDGIDVDDATDGEVSAVAVDAGDPATVDWPSCA